MKPAPVFRKVYIKGNTFTFSSVLYCVEFGFQFFEGFKYSISLA